MYSEYEACIEKAIQDKNLTEFKSNKSYNDILEHVSYEFGAQYLSYIKQLFHLSPEQISMYGRMNDGIGSPKKEYYREDDLTISPTSLRYIFHALLILQHMKSKQQQTVHIVEVGCGYGGLALALSFYSLYFGITIEEYNFVDLPAPLVLQQKYLDHFKLSMKCSFHSASTFGSQLQGSQYFLISNYCFSEISDEFQKNYLRILFPKCSHGFLAWNHIDVYDIGKELTVETEFPLTGSKNKYVRF